MRLFARATIGMMFVVVAATAWIYMLFALSDVLWSALESGS